MLSTALLVGAFPQERGHAATSSDVDEPDLLVEPDSPKVDTIPRCMRGDRSPFEGLFSRISRISPLFQF